MDEPKDGSKMKMKMRMLGILPIVVRQPPSQEVSSPHQDMPGCSLEMRYYCHNTAE